jgi:cyclic pyranopterin phosphate synthase
MHGDLQPRESELSHVRSGPEGARSTMVDVGAKTAGARRATARAVVRFPEGLLAKVLAGGGPKGPVTEVARVLAAKRTPEWIPMCHVLPLDHVDVEFAPLDDRRLEVRCTSACTAKTGVEMEAMVGAAAAALAVYDMTKALDPAISIESVELLAKSGGKSGPWLRPAH